MRKRPRQDGIVRRLAANGGKSFGGGAALRRSLLQSRNNPPAKEPAQQARRQAWATTIAPAQPMSPSPSGVRRRLPQDKFFSAARTAASTSMLPTPSAAMKPNGA